MAITRVNGGSQSLANGGDASVTMSGWSLAQNDLVIAAVGIADNDNVDKTLAMSSTGYTSLTGSDLFANDTSEANLGVFYKFMGATPDTTCTFNGQAELDTASGIAVQVFRGVDTTTPFDVTSTTATGIDTMHPAPPSINHNGTAGIFTVIAVASGHTLGAGVSYTFPTGYTTNPVQSSGNDTSDLSIGMAYNASPSDPESPGGVTLSGTDNVAFAWAAYTMALRPAAGGAGLSIPIAAYHHFKRNLGC